LLGLQLVREVVAVGADLVGAKPHSQPPFGRRARACRTRDVAPGGRPLSMPPPPVPTTATGARDVPTAQAVGGRRRQAGRRSADSTVSTADFVATARATMVAVRCARGATSEVRIGNIARVSPALTVTSEGTAASEDGWP